MPKTVVMRTERCTTETTKVKTIGPVSLESVRRKVMLVVAEVEQTVKSFKSRWLRKACDDNAEEWAEFVLMFMTKGTTKKLRDWKDLREFLNSFRPGDSVRCMPEFPQLVIICERAHKFEDTVKWCCEMLKNLLINYLDKYCRSFAGEMDAALPQAVGDYEHLIEDKRKRILSVLKTLEETPLILTRDYPTVVVFLANYSKVILCMDDTVAAFFPLFENFKSWVTADEGYDHRVNVELKKWEARRLEIKETTRRSSSRIDKHYQAKIQTTSYQLVKVLDAFRELLGQGSDFKKREKRLESDIKKMNGTLIDERTELYQLLEEIAQDLRSGGQVSHGSRLRVNELLEKINVDELESSLAMESLYAVKRNKWASQKDVYYLRGLVKRCKAHDEATKTELLEEKAVLKSGHDELKMTDQVIRDLKRIQRIRHDPDTLKWIYVNGYNPRARLPKRDSIDEAFDLISRCIGRAWASLYHELPFHPTRDTPTRNKDISMVENASRGRDLAVVCMKSLRKWQHLNNVTVRDLITALRKIGNNQLANKLQQKKVLVAS